MRRVGACGLLIAVSSLGASAIFMHPDVKNVPVDRVIANLEKQVAAAPKSVELLVNLARVHAMAFASKDDDVPQATWAGSKIPDAVPWLGSGVPEYKQPRVRTTSDPKRVAAARHHLDRAIARYHEAIALAPDNLVAKLGLGWALTHTSDRTAAIATLREVVEASWRSDQQSSGDARPGPMMGQPYLTEEAVAYLVPLLDPAKDADEIATLRQRARTLEKRPRWITPIAVPLRPGLTATDISADDAAVWFDADGSGMPKRWTWIRPTAAWLVFDRHRSGRIDSALQLFGSVTFWLFWQNGFHALRVLDDDGDGELRGREIDGLALWHDWNSDGSSDRGEVRPLADWDIVALSTTHAYDPAHPDEIAYAPRGVTFGDGSTRQTFDLVLRTPPR